MTKAEGHSSLSPVATAPGSDVMKQVPLGFTASGLDLWLT